MNGAAVARDRIGVWCGGVLVGAAVLTPLLAWLGPLGFAPLMGLVGFLCLPACRIAEEDRPIAVVLLAGLCWAAVSTAWSPFHPTRPANNTALKLALELPLYWSAWCGARRADPKLRRRALLILAWGLAVVGALMLAEAFTGGAIYQLLRTAEHQPIRPDLGRRNLAHASFVLALLWPVAAVGGVRAGAPAWLALPMAAGATVLAWVFLSDAPVLALAIALVAGGAVWTWPRFAPRAMGVKAALYVLLTPLAVLWIAANRLSFTLPLSWAERVGYWTHAVAWISQKPLMGWGLDSSRMFAPGIQLHPHDGALQLWLELGAPGAAAGAVFWALALRRLAAPERSLPAAGAAASAAIYLLFGAVNFGVWQEWWLALGALVAVIAALAQAQAPPIRRARLPAKASTSAASLG